MRNNPFMNKGSKIILKKILTNRKIKNLTNNTTNKSNTTNYSGINNSLSKIFPYTSQRSYFHSPQSTPRNLKKEDLFKSANNIINQRINHISPTKIIPYGFKRTVINTSKEISLKNYMIDLIKKKRNEINNNELIINNTLKSSSDKLEKDYKNFFISIDNLKTEKKREEDKLNHIKIIYDNTLSEYITQLNINKKLNQHIVRIIKLICTLKRYGSFLHKVFDLPFIYDDLVELNKRIKNYEEVGEKIIKLYEKNKNENIIMDILKNENILFQKFNYYEEKLMKVLTDKEIIKKENKNIFIKEKTEINLLNQKIKECQEDLHTLNNNKKKELILIDKYNYNNNDKVNNIKNINDKLKYEQTMNEYMGYIVDIGRCTGLELKNKNNKNTLEGEKDYHIFCQNTLKCLKDKEKNVNEYINKIDNILKYGESEDKELIIKAIANVKKDNKVKKMINVKQQKEQLNNMKRLNDIKRSEKYIICGKKVIPDYPFNLCKKKKKKIINKQNIDDYEYLYYSSEEENDLYDSHIKQH